MSFAFDPMRFPTAVTMLALCMAEVVIPMKISAAEVETGQHPRHFSRTVGDKTLEMDYLLFLPADYGKEARKKWPLIFFLHGSGERGSNVEVVKKHGPPKIVEQKPDFPFIVVSPQCPEKLWWQTDVLSALLDEVIKQYSVDADRVYLTGLSMGGFGTWAWAAQEPKRFAAIVPICGGGDPTTADRLANLPIWVFHGEQDTSVPIEKSEAMVEALKPLHADVHFTRYPDAGHDCWTRTYDNPKLYEWLLSHKRGEAKKNKVSDQP